MKTGVTVKIRDNGIGMTRQEQQSVWEPSGKKSSGIGLANVRDRVRQFYGENHDVTLTSARGEGTEVELLIKKQVPGEAEH